MVEAGWWELDGSRHLFQLQPAIQPPLTIQLLPTIQLPPAIQLLPAILPAIKLLPVIHPAPVRHPAPACEPAPAIPLPPAIQLSSSSSCLLPSACPLSLCMSFSFSSRLIVLAEVARGGGRLIGGRARWECELVRVQCFSPSRQVLSRRFWVLAIEAGSRSCRQDVCVKACVIKAGCDQGGCGCLM